MIYEAADHVIYEAADHVIYTGADHRVGREAHCLLLLQLQPEVIAKPGGSYSPPRSGDTTPPPPPQVQVEGGK